jgi:hypothetical protein
MSKHLQSLLDLLGKTKRHITIYAADYPFESLCRIGKELKAQDKTMTLVIGRELTDFQIGQLVDASDDRFNFEL